MGTEDTNKDANDWIWASAAATELANAQGLENYLAEAARAKRIFRELCIAINNTELNVYPPGVTGTRVERPVRSSEPEFPTDDYPIKRSSLEAWWQSKKQPIENAPDFPSATQTPDFKLLATPKQLIDAFGAFTDMKAEWFKSLKDKPALFAARKVAGRGGRETYGFDPLFCPLEVMQWLTDPKRKTGSKRLSQNKGWQLLKSHFPDVYNKNSAASPLDD